MSSFGPPHHARSALPSDTCLIRHSSSPSRSSQFMGSRPRSPACHKATTSTWPFDHLTKYLILRENLIYLWHGGGEAICHTFPPHLGGPARIAESLSSRRSHQAISRIARFTSGTRPAPKMKLC